MKRFIVIAVILGGLVLAGCGAQSSSGAQSDYNTVASDCQQLQTDVTSLQGDDISSIPSNAQAALTQAEASLSAGAGLCIYGAQNMDGTSLENAASDFSSATANINQATADLPGG